MIQKKPPDFPPVTWDIPMKSIDQGDATDSHAEGRLVVEGKEQFTAYVNPLVQQPPMGDT